MFDLQLFAYQTTDLVTVGQVKSLATRIALRLTALENTAIKSVQVVGNALKFYSCAKADITQTTVPVDSFDIPEEIYLSQTGTDIIQNFTWSATTYPGSTDPNLDGKTVLVLAVRGDDATNPTVKYSFVNMSGLIGDFIPKDTLAGAGNLSMWQSDGTITNASIAAAGVLTTITGSTTDNVMAFGSDGKVTDSGHAIATDAEFADMLDEVFPTVTGGDSDSEEESEAGGY